jgi:hypothetical protein
MSQNRKHQQLSSKGKCVKIILIVIKDYVDTEDTKDDTEVLASPKLILSMMLDNKILIGKNV